MVFATPVNGHTAPVYISALVSETMTIDRTYSVQSLESLPLRLYRYLELSAALVLARLVAKVGGSILYKCSNLSMVRFHHYPQLDNFDVSKMVCLCSQ